MVKPLEHIRILDLTNVLAGPFCCHQLVHLGAEVIKVEVPERGDLARQLGADLELNERLMGTSFLAQNAGKRSLTLNLKHEEGRVLFRKLVGTADVVVENFRPGVMDRLGLGFEMLRQVNPQLVYCAISGYGQNGPLRDSPAYDQIVQGLSGAMSVTGTDTSGPLRAGFPIADTLGGLTAALGVCAALAKPQREAMLIDVSMLESTMAAMGWVISNHLSAGVAPAPMGNENFTSAPSGTFQTGEGLLNIAANKQEQYEALCQLLNREDLLHRQEFANRELRKQNRHRLRELLEAELVKDTAHNWAVRLNTAGVPAGEVLQVAEALNQPQIQERGFLETVAAVPGVGRTLKLVRTGMQLNGSPLSVERPPPRLGEDTDALLRELGCSEEEIDHLRKEGAV